MTFCGVISLKKYRCSPDKAGQIEIADNELTMFAGDFFTIDKESTT